MTAADYQNIQRMIDATIGADELAGMDDLDAVEEQLRREFEQLVDDNVADVQHDVDKLRDQVEAL